MLYDRSRISSNSGASPISLPLSPSINCASSGISCEAQGHATQPPLKRLNALFSEPVIVFGIALIEMLLAQLPNLDARSREAEKFRLDNLQMKIGSAIIAAGFSLLGILAVRRSVLISLARRRWNTLAFRLGLARRPIGCFRVALTGPSSGIGQACMELLKDYPGVIVTPIGRNLSPPCGIQVDLTDG